MYAYSVSTKRSIVVAVAPAAVLISICISHSCVGQTLSVNFRGTMPLGTTATDQNGQEFTVTGLSGLTWVQDTLFVAVMDNSDKLVLLDVQLDVDGAISFAAIVGGLTLAESRDFEGIAYTTVDRDSVFLCEEDTPAVREYRNSDGALLQTLDTPPVFFNLRPNFGFESLSRHPAGTELWTANEEALTVDGELSTPQDGTVVRLLRYTLSGQTGIPTEQFAYITEPMHGGAITGGRSGLVDLAVLPNGKILALERSFAFSIPDFFESRLYELDFSDATNVSGFVDGLIDESFTPVAKHLLWSGSVGNLEGLALGPSLIGGNESLLGIVDDGDPLSTNQLVAFELLLPGGTPCPWDLDGSGDIGVKDLLILLGAWGPCPPKGDCPADFDGSGAVDVKDLLFLLGNWGACP